MDLVQRGLSQLSDNLKPHLPQGCEGPSAHCRIDVPILFRNVFLTRNSYREPRQCSKLVFLAAVLLKFLAEHRSDHSGFLRA